MIRLARRGDREAANRLERLAVRTADPRARAVAAAALDDHETLARHAAQALVTGRDATARDHLAGLGITLDTADAAQLRARLGAVNTNVDFELSLVHVLLSAADAARSRRGVAYHAASRGREHEQTALCLAVRIDRHRIAVDLGAAPARRPTPGRVWDTLQPWRHARVSWDQQGIASWARTDERFVIGVLQRQPDPEGPRPVYKAMDDRESQLDAILSHPDRVTWGAVVELFEHWPTGVERNRALRRLRHAAFINEGLVRRASNAIYQRWCRGESVQPLLDRLALPRRLDRPRAIALLDATWLTRIRALDLRSNLLDGSWVSAFRSAAADGRFEQLETLRLDGNVFRREGQRQLLSSPGLQALTRLTLNGASDPLSLPEPLDTLDLPALEVLSLDQMALGDTGVSGLARAPGTARLRTLRLAENDLTPDGVEALTRARQPHALVHLDLSRNPGLGDPAAALIGHHTALPKLARIDLSRTGISEVAVRHLADAPIAGRLDALILAGNPLLTDEGLTCLAEASWPSLQRLDVAGASFTDEALRRHLPTLLERAAPTLEVLDLRHIALDTAAAEALARSPAAARLQRLRLSPGLLDDDAIAALRASEHLRASTMPELQPPEPERVQYPV